MDDNAIRIFQIAAWPLVAILAIIFVWRTDALNKIIRISDSVDQLKKLVADFEKSQVSVENSIRSIGRMVEDLSSVDAQIADIDANVKSVQDSINLNANEQNENDTNKVLVDSKSDLDVKFEEMQTKWNDLNKIISDKFGPFDRRATAAEVYRFAHKNRTKPISYELAEEIGVIHSSIKSYRRLKSNITEWLNETVYSDFLRRCDTAISQLEIYENF